MLQNNAYSHDPRWALPPTDGLARPPKKVRHSSSGDARRRRVVNKMPDRRDGVRLAVSGTLNEYASVAGQYMIRPASLFWHLSLPWRPARFSCRFSQCAANDKVIDEWGRPSFPAPDRTKVREG
jgi:hypothetical protein